MWVLSTSHLYAFINEGIRSPNKILVSLADLEGKTKMLPIILKQITLNGHKGCQAELAPSKLKRALESAAKRKRKV